MSFVVRRYIQSRWWFALFRTSQKVGLVLAGLIGLVVGADAAAPINDDFANASVLTGRVGTMTGNLLEATREVDERAIGGDSSRGSVWYEWNGTESGLLHLTDGEGTREIGFAAVIGSSAEAYAIVANGTGPLAVNIEPEETTKIVVGYETNLSVIDDGMFTFEWEFVSAPTIGIPVITGEVSAGNTIDISVQGTGEGELTYTWFHDGSQINGITGDTLRLESLSPDQAGKYQVAVSSRGGVTRSEEITVTGSGLGPVIVQQPVGVFASVGQAVVLSAQATGESTITFQWRRHGIDLAGETAAQFQIAAASMTDTNIYDVVVTDSIGSRSSDRVRVTVSPSRELDKLRFREGWEVSVEKRGARIQGIAPAGGGGFWVAGEISRFGDEAVKQVIRLMEDGSLDSSFELGDTIAGTIEGVAPASDGGVWIWGRIGRTAGGRLAGGIRRVGESGQLVRHFDVSEIGAQTLLSADVDADGNLYALIRFISGKKRLIRLTGNGRLDPSYTTLDEALTDTQGIAVSSDQIVFAWSDTELKRFDTSGTLDSGFSFDLGIWNALIKVAAGPNNEIVVLGTTDSRSSYVQRPLGWQRLSSEGGVVDGQSGLADLSPLGGILYEIKQLVIDHSGVPYLTGRNANTGMLMRLVFEGAESKIEPLLSFGPNSSGNTVAGELDGNFAFGESGQILVGGAFGQIDGTEIDSLALRPADGAVAAVVESVWSAGEIVDMVQQASGAVVLAGDFGKVNGEDADGVARVNGEGKLDRGFRFERETAGPIRGMAEDGAGRLLIGGEFKLESKYRRISRLRLSPDGAVDLAFAVGESVGVARNMLALHGGASLTDWDLAGNVATYSESGAATRYYETDYRQRSVRNQVDGALLISGVYRGTGQYPGSGLLGQRAAVVRALPNWGADRLFGMGNRLTGSYLDMLVFPDESSVQLSASSSVKINRHGKVDTNFRSWRWSPRSSFYAATRLGSDRVQIGGEVYLRWSETEATEYWQTRYWMRINPDGSVDESAKLEGLNEAVSAMVQRDDGNFYIATAGRVRVTESLPPEITMQPVSRFVGVDESVQLQVEVSGSGLSYQWRKNGVAIAGATATDLNLNSVSALDQGGYDVVVSNGSSEVTSSLAIVGVNDGVAQNVAGHHRLDPNGGLPIRASRIENTVSYGGDLGQLRWSVVLPEGWSASPVIDTITLGAESYPADDSIDLAEWTWTSVPTSGFTFSYTLTPPEELVGSSEIAAVLTATRVGGDAIGLVTPDPLVVVARAKFHDADVDRDRRFSLSELLRVIELYNTRFGTTRTGRYRMTENSADGFDPDGTSNDDSILLRHHTSDTDRDGRLSLSELLRVIELYNTRSGTTRTGAYRVGEGTGDGFVAGE